MMKKVGAVILGVVAAMWVVNCTRVGSYTCTAWKQLRDEASKQVSVEFEIKRLKNEVAQLEPDINRNRSIVAEEIVAVERLREDLDQGHAKLAKQKEEIRRIVSELKSGAEKIVYNGREFSADRVRERLDQDVDSASRCEKALKSKERVLDARERILEANKKKLQAMRDEKDKLTEQIALLEAEYKEVQVRQTQSRVQIDDSRLADIKKSLDGLRSRVRVEKVELDLANNTDGGEEKAKSNTEVVRKAEQFLQGDKEETKVATEQK